MQGAAREHEGDMLLCEEAENMDWWYQRQRWLRDRSLGQDESWPSPKNQGNLFGNIHRLKDTDVRQQMAARKDREKAKYKDTPIGAVAKSDFFERATLFVISLNAISIGIDADYTARIGKPDNIYKSPPFFIVVELFFAVYFTLEIMIRFIAYRRKHLVFFDFWFMFDSILVSLMLVEVLIVPFVGSNSPLGQLSVLRLLRLLRITRVAKLLRMFPELMMIVTGIKAAVKAVCWTAFLLILITFTWAILFTNEYHQGKMSDEEARELDGAEHLFGSMSKSMISLLVMGTILDDVTYATDTIRATGKTMMLFCFIVYILLNSFTMMNMLVGILVEVVGSTAEQEKSRLAGEQAKESMREIFLKMDDDGNGQISRDEFKRMSKNPKVESALQRMDIQGKHFEVYAKLLFENEEEGVENTLDFDDMLEMMMRLRPGKHVSALDFATLKQKVFKGQADMATKLSQVEHRLDMLHRAPPGSFGTHSCRYAGLSGGVDTPLLRSSDNTQPVLQLPPAPFTARPKLVTMQMLMELEMASEADIVAEIQRRLGMPNLEETGVPLSRMDEDLQQCVQDFECPTIPGALNV